MPNARYVPYASAARARDRAKPAPDDQRVDQEHRDDAHEAQLLADDGADEVGVRLGQEEQLLSPVARARRLMSPPEPKLISDSEIW